MCDIGWDWFTRPGQVETGFSTNPKVDAQTLKERHKYNEHEFSLTGRVPDI